MNVTLSGWMLDPLAARIWTSMFMEEINNHQIEYVCGADEDTIPIVSCLVLHSAMQSSTTNKVCGSYIRTPKAHGTKAEIEGHPPPSTKGAALIITETVKPSDVLLQWRRAKNLGVNITRVFALLDYGHGVKEAVEEVGCPFYALYTEKN